jgi:hypothetical protein
MGNNITKYENRKHQNREIHDHHTHHHKLSKKNIDLNYEIVENFFKVIFNLFIILNLNSF